MYPVFLRLTDRLAVVVGGGPVGRRKAAALLQAGARVRLVCLEPRPAEQTAPPLDWIVAAYHPQHLESAHLVIAAATAEVNRAVLADAHSRGLWACSASEPDAGDFLTAATVRRGDLILALGTSGQVPPLTRVLRGRLEELLDARWGDWLRLLAELRPLVQSRLADAGLRQRLWEELCAESWLERAEREAPAQVRAAVLAACEKLLRMSASEGNSSPG